MSLREIVARFYPTTNLCEALCANKRPISIYSSANVTSFGPVI